ncbi:MAG: VTT domain-containing protein [Actinomycetaceae bacterium]|nr:VTT domain-containing protein [Actinomycetaceae bacterium]
MFSEFLDFLKEHYVLYFGFFVTGVAMRSQCFYWLGRYGNHALGNAQQPDDGFKLKVWEKIHDPKTEEMKSLINRRGIIIIPLSFLTIAIQSVINFSAGLTAMPWPRYTLAAIPGWFVWAAIYSSAGFFALKATIAKPVTVLVLLLIILIAYFGVYRPYKRLETH